MIQNLQMTRLSNGIRVVTDEMPQSGLVAIQCHIDAGSADESDSIAGIAHLLEHMVFKGTAGYNAHALVDGIERRGGRINASTGHYSTRYEALVLPCDLHVAMAMISDMVRAPLLRSKDFDAEKKVVIREIQDHMDDPDGRMNDMTMRACWGTHSQGRSVAGTVESVQGISIGQLRSFHDRRYRPNAMVFSFAGPIGHDEAVEAVQAQMGSLDGFSINGRTSPVLHRQFLSARDCDTTRVAVCWPAPDRLSKDHNAAFALQNILSGGMASPLWQALREDRSLCYYSGMRYQPLNMGGTINLVASTSEDSLDELLQVAADTILGTVMTAVTPEQVRRSKAASIVELNEHMESTESRACFNGAHTLSHGQPISMADLVTDIDAVTADDVVRLANSIFSEQPAMAVMGPMRHDPYQTLETAFGGWKSEAIKAAS